MREGVGAAPLKAAARPPPPPPSSLAVGDLALCRAARLGRANKWRATRPSNRVARLIFIDDWGFGPRAEPIGPCPPVASANCLRRAMAYGGEGDGQARDRGDQEAPVELVLEAVERLTVAWERAITVRAVGQVARARLAPWTAWHACRRVHAPHRQTLTLSMLAGATAAFRAARCAAGGSGSACRSAAAWGCTAEPLRPSSAVGSPGRRRASAGPRRRRARRPWSGAPFREAAARSSRAGAR